MKNWILGLICLGLSLAHSAMAQSTNPYGVAVRVNEKVITNFEISQRIILMQAFGTTGDLRKISTDQLIDDRLRFQAGLAAGITVSPEEIEAGVEEFAARGKITGAQLYQYIKSRGAAPESMRDFVRAGLIWRSVVQSRFANRATVSDSEIDTALNLSSAQVQQSVLISEIQMPLNQRGDERTLQLANELSQSIKSEAAFGAAARRYSRAPSRARSGRLDWLPISSLPPALAGQIMALEPGEVSAPITLSQTVALFQLRGVRAEQNTQNEVTAINYVTVNVPLGKGENAQLENAVALVNDVDTCADLRAQSERFSIPGFEELTSEIPQLPATLAFELAKLDRHEASYYTPSQGSVHVVMVCNRLRELPEGARENIRNALFNQRITGFGSGYLQELKGDAVIVYK